jgi:hypothetical protein
MPSVAHKLYMLSVYAECRYTECPGVECYVAPTIGLLDLAVKASQR